MNQENASANKLQISLNVFEIKRRLQYAIKALEKDSQQLEQEMMNYCRMNIVFQEQLNDVIPLEAHVAMARVLGVSLHWYLFGIPLIETDLKVDQYTAHQTSRDPHD